MIHLLRRYCFAGFATCCLFIQLASQEPRKLPKSDTISLLEVDIVTDRERLSKIGRRTEVVDSLLLRQFLSQSVSEALTWGSALFVRSYGPGAAAAPAFRGASAAQSAVVWEGFNLQNSMLGYTDLSLFPAMMFRNIRIEHGASAASWGSGAMAGAIHLGVGNNSSGGLSVLLNSGAGSFGRRTLSGRVETGSRKLRSLTQFYSHGSRNDFYVYDSLDLTTPYKKQQNAAYCSQGFLQSVNAALNEKNSVGVKVWLSRHNRQIPSYNPSSAGRASENDESARLAADYRYRSARFRSTTRAAFFHEKILYNDSLLRIRTNNQFRTLMAENENTLIWNSRHESNISVVFNNSRGSTEFYHGSQSLMRTGVVAGHQLRLLSGRLTLAGHLRGEHFSAGRLPVTWNAGAIFRIARRFTVNLNGGKVYRHPSLNEFFWVPGGNVSLRPEEGFSAEGSLTYKYIGEKVDLELSGSLFSRAVENWILWLPGAAGSPEARNIQKVWSRGTDSKSVLRVRGRDLTAELTVMSSYVLSTVSQTGLASDVTLGRQLPFTPRYVINSHFSLAYKKIVLFLFNQYTGYRFISSDNLQWMSPYNIPGTRISYQLNARGISAEIFGSVHNIFNRTYAVMPGRPMPGRNYEAGVSVQFNRQKKSIQ